MSWTLYEVTTHQTIQTTFYVEVEVPEGDQPEAPYWEVSVEGTDRQTALKHHGTLIDYVKFHEGGDPTLPGSD